MRRTDTLKGCRTVDQFKLLEELGEGTFGIVYKALDGSTGEVIALKQFLPGMARKDDQLREIALMRSCGHPSVVEFKEVVTDHTRKAVSVAMEYVGPNLSSVMKVCPRLFTDSEVRSLMWQLLQGVKCLHDKKILHRDLKTSNILMNRKGKLKICDFGLACQRSGRVPYVREVVSLWYRAPELLLGTSHYTSAIDMWSLGCIMAELLTKKVLFAGESEDEQLEKIIEVLGTPNVKTWPGFNTLPGAPKVKSQPNRPRDRLFQKLSRMPRLSKTGLNLLRGLLTYDPNKRLTVDAALSHPWFKLGSKTASSSLSCWILA